MNDESISDLGGIFEDFVMEQDTFEKQSKELVVTEPSMVEIMPLGFEEEKPNAFSHLINPTNQNQKPYVSPALRYITSLRSETSQKTMHYALKRVAAILDYDDYKKFPWEDLNIDVVRLIIGKLREESLSPVTINTYLTAIKQTCKNAWLDHLMPQDTYLRIASIEGEKGQRISKGRSLHGDEFRKLLSTCRDFSKPINIRDAAIIALARACGLRRQEITLLTMDRLNMVTGTIIIRGKGNKERKLTVPREIMPIIKKWIDFKESYNWRKSTPEEIFNPFHKTGHLMARPLSAMAIHNIFEQRRTEAGIEKFSPHDLRRTFATELLKNNIEITDVQKLMGHSSVATTQIYDKRDDQRIMDIMENSSIL